MGPILSLRLVRGIVRLVPSAPAALVSSALLALIPMSAAAGSPEESGRPVYRQANQSWVVPRQPAASEQAPEVPIPAAAQDRAAGDWLFAPNVRPHPETIGLHLWPDVAVHPSGMIGVSWMGEDETGNFHIYYAASTDGGQSWSSPEKVDDRTTGSYSKFVDLRFTPAGIAVAVWEDDRTSVINVYLSRRDPAHGGSPWTSNVRVNTAGSPSSGSYYMNPSVAVLDEDRFFVAWTDWREGVFNQVYARTTRTAGATWGPEARVSDEIGYQPLAGDPCLIVDPASGGVPGTETLFCVMDDWRGYAPGGRFPDVYFSRSTDGGASWSHGLPVNDVTDYFQQTSSHGLVLLPDGTLTAGWLSGDFAVYSYRASFSTDHGATWQTSVQVDDPALGGPGTWSSIAASGNYLFAGMDAYQGDWNSYFRVSPDGGRSWPDRQQRMDDDASGSATGNTVVGAISPTELIGVFQDTRPGYGPWLIYTAHGTRDPAGLGPFTHLAAGEITLRCVPNPSWAGREVELRLPNTASAASSDPSMASVVRIFDPRGRLIQSLPLGAPFVIWDGRDTNGRLMPAGLYLAKIDGANEGVPIVRVR